MKAVPKASSEPPWTYFKCIKIMSKLPKSGEVAFFFQSYFLHISKGKKCENKSLTSFFQFCFAIEMQLQTWQNLRVLLELRIKMRGMHNYVATSFHSIRFPVLLRLLRSLESLLSASSLVLSFVSLWLPPPLPIAPDS